MRYLLCTQGMNLHVHSIRNNIYKFVCGSCGHGFNQNSNFDSNMNHHTNTKHTCFTCGREFGDKITLLAHTRICCVCTNLVTCQICMKLFKAKCYLHEHMKSHEQSCSFICEFVTSHILTGQHFSTIERVTPSIMNKPNSFSKVLKEMSFETCKILNPRNPSEQIANKTKERIFPLSLLQY